MISPSSGGRGTLDTYSTRHSIADARARRQVVLVGGGAASVARAADGAVTA
jgi:hypothetical protein